MKKAFFYVALASLTLTTSCSQDDLQTSQASENEIQFHASMGLKSRAEETKITNLSSFYVTAFKANDANYMQDVEYTNPTTGDADASTKWIHSGTDTYFWPVEGTLNFYAYAYGHNKTATQTQTALSSVGATVNIDKTNHKIENFKPATGTDGTASSNQADASKQEDLIYAVTTGTKATDATNGISLNFNHALSQISIQAKNINKAYKVEVKGVKIGGVKDQGTFTFPEAGGTSAASWTTSKSSADTEITYETSSSTATSTLGESASAMTEISNVPFMLLPQTLSKNTTTKYKDGSYIALNITITMKSGVDARGNNVYEGQVIYDNWAYVGIGDTWDMGKHYTYTLDFSEGAGQDAQGNQIISGKEIGLDVAVTDWNNAENINVYPDIDVIPTEANCLIMNSPGKVYAINIASKPNAFWTSAAGGNLTAPIDDDTKWTAEVIWQDITNYVKNDEDNTLTPSKVAKRAIDFYDIANNKANSDTNDTIFSGTGKTLYIQLRSDQTYRGNIVVGVKKKGANDSDGYLWSWHLWLTDDPLCFGTFMDRNLGATDGLMTTASHPSNTFGTFYQFGRKDPLARDIHYFNINGDLIGLWEEKTKDGTTVRPYVVSGPVDMSATVKSPLQFYNTTSGAWVSSETYINNSWNDINGITDGKTKTFFDPCPDGWRLPTKDELSPVISGGAVGSFIWKEMTLKGWVYQGNWFAASGYLQCQAAHNNTYFNEQVSGFVWSSTPVSLTHGYGIYFSVSDSGKDGNATTNRGDGASVRCVRDN